MKSLSETRVNYEEFKEFLWRKGWTQKSLAEVLGIDNSTISKYVSQGLPMPGRLIIGIAYATRMSPSDIVACLLGGSRQ